MKRKSPQSFKIRLTFPEKWFCISWPNFSLWSLELILFGSKKSISAFHRLQKKFTENSNIRRKFSWSFNICAAFPEKWFCICWLNFTFLGLVPIFNHFKESKFIDNSKTGKKCLGSFNVNLLFPEKWFCIYIACMVCLVFRQPMFL